MGIYKSGRDKTVTGINGFDCRVVPEPDKISFRYGKAARYDFSREDINISGVGYQKVGGFFSPGSFDDLI
jgi:hypothetical protein